MLMVGLAMIVLIVFVGVIYYLFSNYSEEKNINKLQDLGYSLQSELILASEVEPGYERTVIIPDKAGGADYEISQTSNDLVIKYRKTELLFPIPKVSGSLNKGNNVIRQCGETIKINSAC
jgi:hypothetical protein